MSEQETSRRDTNGDWRNKAACLNRRDPDLFFPEGKEPYRGHNILQAEEAKAVCRRCPVARECLDWSLTTGQDYGIWGGLTTGERRELKLRQTKQTKQQQKVGATAAELLRSSSI